MGVWKEFLGIFRGFLGISWDFQGFSWDFLGFSGVFLGFLGIFMVFHGISACQESSPCQAPPSPRPFGAVPLAAASADRPSWPESGGFKADLKTLQGSKNSQNFYLNSQKTYLKTCL